MKRPVVGLGYVVAEATDLDAWREFAVDLFGLQPVVDTGDRLLLRLDEKAHRFDVRRGDRDAVTTLGWEVATRKGLNELGSALTEAGYDVRAGSDDEAAQRMVTELLRLRDPDGVELEFFYGLRTAREPFVSRTGARFKTGSEGLGHVFQVVRDNDAFRDLYEGILGFGVSDYIDLSSGAAATFLHCNPRHHSFAYAPIEQAPAGIGHVMFEVDDIDVVGRAWDRVVSGAAPISETLGRHANDEMISFYAVSPSGFRIEYGYGGLAIDEETFTPTRYEVESRWGHERVT